MPTRCSEVIRTASCSWRWWPIEIYRSTAVIKAFDLQEGLNHMGNWLFLTGSLSASNTSGRTTASWPMWHRPVPWSPTANLRISLTPGPHPGRAQH